MSNRMRNKKLRKKSEAVKRLRSLNELHDLKNQHVLDRDMCDLMQQSNLLKPKKYLSVQCRLPKRKGKKMPVVTIK